MLENSSCNDESSFTITIDRTPTASTVPTQTACDQFELPIITSGNYFTGSGGTGTQLNASDFITTTQVIYIYVGNASCNDESSFTITIDPTPTASIVPTQTVCDQFELPTITSGNYFTGSGGTGTQLNAGDFITTTQVIYIYVGNASCNDESSFTITIDPTPTASTVSTQTACDQFELPTIASGNYFTGSGGTGTQLNSGDFITTTQIIYIYVGNASCNDESSFTITINPTPTASTVPTQTVCDQFELPTITSGNYFYRIWRNRNATQFR